MKRTGEAVLRDVGGQALLVPIGAKVGDLNALITLNATGRRVWELLAEDLSADSLVSKIAAEFRADPETVRPDILSFVERLRGWGLLEP
ncbi:MAG TPA: PqqD family protein [Candidatus Bathyarchaeia archaeon]|nr:PqqD family protein [Candidatus Bathyarchaeia archaeon]